MMLDIDKMDGYEFEEFIANLLKKMGFKVEITPLSGDKGVDIIAYSDKPIIKGKYLIQCKNWSGKIGEPAIRDLYGVVLSNNANKGVLITNSFFTQQAVDFADGKNIELINGDVLNELVYAFLPQNKSYSVKKDFRKSSEFETDKYGYLKHNLDTNKRDLQSYIDMFNFLHSYILDKQFDLMYTGLIDECISLSTEIIKRFGKNNKKGFAIKSIFTTMNGFLNMLQGNLDVSFETVYSAKKLNFSVRNFAVNLINNYMVFNPGHLSYDRSFEASINVHMRCVKQMTGVLSDNEYIIYKANLLNLLRHINDDDISKWLYNGFTEYYNKVFEMIANENFTFTYEKDSYEEITLENYNSVTKRIESVMNNDNLKLHIPTSWYFNKDDYGYFGLSYDDDKFINIKEIAPYWPQDLDSEKQLKKMRLLISLIEN